MLRTEDLFDDVKQLNKKKKRKQELRKTIKKTIRKRNSFKKNKFKAVIDGTLRTQYENIYESHLKLLGIPYHINTIFCFTCNNFYDYADVSNLPRKCMVCQVEFWRPDGKGNNENKGMLCRPDIIIDWNTDETKSMYRKHRQHHNLEDIKRYQADYLKKIGILRVDGGIHEKRRVKMRDYHQYQDFKERHIKVFIITNDDIDMLLDKQDNGASLLKHCHLVSGAVLDDALYHEYCQDKDFKYRTSRPL